MKTFKKIFSLLIGIVWLFGCGETTTDPIKTVLSNTELLVNALETNVSSTTATSTSDAELVAAIEKANAITTFLLTDAPSDDFKGVMVDILKIVVVEDGKTIDVPLPDNLPIRVDLLELDEVSDMLASADLPVGTITQIGLKISNPEIILLDDTVIPASGIDVESKLMITLATPAVVDGTGGAVLIDFDVENSIKIDVAGSGKYIFRPKGGATRVDERPDRVEAKHLRGTVAEIRVIKDDETSFLLKHHGRRHFIHVDVATTTEIYELQGEMAATTTFDALKKGQHVKVDGFFTDRGVLKAKTVLILPVDHQGMRGLVTRLNQENPSLHTFELLLLKHDLEVTDMDRKIATTTATTTPALATTTATTTARTTVKVQYNPEKVHILLNHPHRKLSPGDLTNGQMVFVGGPYKDDAKAIQAHVIIVKSDRIRGFIAEAPNCIDKLIRVVHPFKEHRRLLATGIDLQPHNSGIVDISEAKIFGPEGTEIGCARLRQGMAVKVFGRMIPHTPDAVDLNPVRFKAFEVKVIAVHHVGGEVVSLIDGDFGHVKGVILNVSLDLVNGFDRPKDCLLSATTDCNHLKLPVIFSKWLYNPDGIMLNKELVGQKIRAAGFFMGEPATTADAPRRPSFLAIVIRKGLPVKEPISPIDGVVATSTVVVGRTP